MSKKLKVKKCYYRWNNRTYEVLQFMKCDKKYVIKDQIQQKMKSHDSQHITND